MCFDSKYQQYGILQGAVIAVCLPAFPSAWFGFT